MNSAEVQRGYDEDSKFDDAMEDLAAIEKAIKAHPDNERLIEYARKAREYVEQLVENAGKAQPEKIGKTAMDSMSDVASETEKKRIKGLEEYDRGASTYYTDANMNVGSNPEDAQEKPDDWRYAQ